MARARARARRGPRAERASALGALALACALAAPAAADRELDVLASLAPRAARQDGGRADGVTPRLAPSEEAARAALERGLAFLASQQALERDGSFPAGERPQWSPVGVTALCTLAFLGSGSTATRGPYHAEVDRAVRYLLARVSRPESRDPGYIRDEGDEWSRMHGHGLATLALAEAYGMAPESREELARALAAAVACIERSQSSEGGWHYEPVASSLHEGSVTVCVVQALRAAKNAGLLVDGDRIAHAIDYLKRLQQENGAFAYTLGTPERTSVALTAAGLATLHATGVYRGNEVEDAYDWLWRELAAREEARRAGDRSLDPAHPFYERFYLAQALWQNPDESVFYEWYEKELRAVLKAQQADGSWPSGHAAGGHEEGVYGSSYSTAMNCLFLALPDGLLPIFQR